MRRIFISFLGVGRDNGYTETTYVMADFTSSRTRFAQRAVVERHGSPAFERVFLLVTEESQDKTFGALKAELLLAGLLPEQIEPILISGELEPESQWAWFDRLVALVEPNDRIVMDVTHGFRAVQIVLTAALGYLRRIKNVEVEAVVYGKEPPPGSGPGQLVDMTSFFVMQDWADGVSRLLEGADARRLADLAGQASSGSFGGLQNDELVRSLQRLTDVLRNVEVHAIDRTVRDALRVLEAQRENARTESERHLLQTVADKFTALVVGEPTEGRYTHDYLALQVRAAQMLLEHGLFMQAFTVLRELVGSIGLYGLAGTKYVASQTSGEGFKHRRRFAEAFVAMVRYPRSDWRFESDPQRRDVETLVPWYEALERAGALTDLAARLRELADIRDGFDHAWTGKRLSSAVTPTEADPFAAIKAKGLAVVDALDGLLARLPEPPPASR